MGYEQERRPFARGRQQPFEKRPGQFELYKDSQDLHRWRLVAPNGEIVAASEAYKSKQAAQKGIKAVKNAAANAEITN